jgi:catechol 2,3-dioxygenase-like lactoylglutathione lyase family enzyme
MSVQVYGCNHVAIEVDDVEKAVAFYKDVFNLEQMSGGEGDAFSNWVNTSSSRFLKWTKCNAQTCGISG